MGTEAAASAPSSHSTTSAAAPSPVAESALKLGDRVTVTATDIAFGGEGVARAGEFVLFVPFLLIGETAEVEVVELKKRFGRASLLRLIESSPHRVQPRCPVFTQCGGCQYQHLDYAEQLRVKQTQVAALVERVGRFNPSVVRPVVACPAPYGYRNRIMIRSQWDKTIQALHVGFLMHESRFVVDIDACPIAEPELSQQIARVRANPPPKGGIKVVLRIPPKDWVVPNDSFFQNNFHALPFLVEAVAASIRESGCRFLIDAYCGVGFFALELAHLVDRFIGVEIDGPAVRAARQNAENRKVSNGEFRAGRTEQLLPSILTEVDPARSCIILDPPRTGCDPDALESIASQRIHQITYVSCHPATLARDLRTLCDRGGYELVSITPIDMFPQTAHVECVAVVRLPTANAAGK